MLILKSTGERYLTTLLFEGIDAEMSEEELALSRSTPSAEFPPA
jgi:cysteine synthase